MLLPAKSLLNSCSSPISTADRRVPFFMTADVDPAGGASPRDSPIVPTTSMSDLDITHLPAYSSASLQTRMFRQVKPVAGFIEFSSLIWSSGRWPQLTSWCVNRASARKPKAMCQHSKVARKSVASALVFTPRRRKSPIPRSAK